MITFNKEKDIEEFLTHIVKLTPEEFIALGKVLDVKMSSIDKETGKYTLRDAEEIIQDMIVSFRNYKHKERKLILKVVRNCGPRT